MLGHKSEGVLYCSVNVVVLPFLSTSGDGAEPPSLPPLASPCFLFSIRATSLPPIFSISFVRYDAIDILTFELTMARVEQ